MHVTVCEPGDEGKSYSGRGMIISHEGEVIAGTSREEPFVTVDIELSEAVAAKETYPRYVRE